ncbi:MAG: multidrug efflux protein [Gammaproteobacteria bacterium RIFCSPHIGHO2_12_FULL_45_9]|nr:MAG: multidrug efflux protein [Gammaproteobacteria bacterium RIFCSPHIGHO2_12_FULL_45_9]
MNNKRFTDIFVSRPVLATVVSLLILVLGIKAVFMLAVREYPKMDNTLITITTIYPGAPEDLVEGFITQKIEQSVASAEGVDYMTSSSVDGMSTINVNVRLNFDPNTAMTDVLSKVQQVQSDLPAQAQLPQVVKASDDQTALMYVGFDSPKMSPEQVTDYISRVIQPKIETVNGVSQVQILGAKTFAMRVWLDSQRMAALGVTPTDVVNVLTANNFQAAAGMTKGNYTQISVTASTDVEDPEAFSKLVVKSGKGAIVRVRDVANVELGPQNYNASVYFNGQKAIFIGITATPSANPLTVIADVKKLLPELQKQYPPTLTSKVVYDATKYIQTSIDEVALTILEAALIVIVVIYLFLGSLRTVLIPVVTIPLSMIGVCFFMFAMGYSINLLTLLAMVLAIGLVVDDAIVVVENIYRYIEQGDTPFQAALKGAREIAVPIVSMTITLAAVYAPIGFMGGLTGALFTEFAFTLAGSVIVSGLIALTLSPMMCSKLLTPTVGEGQFVQWLDHLFETLKQRYEVALHSVLSYRPAVVLVAATVLVSCLFLFINTKSELAPTEDQGAIFVMATSPQYANMHYVERYTDQLTHIYQGYPAAEDSFIVNGNGGQVYSTLSGLILKPWDERSQSQADVLKTLQTNISAVAGVRAVAFPLAPLPGSGSGLPVQFVLTTVNPFEDLYPLAEQLKQAALASGLFLYVDNSLSFDKPKWKFTINRDKAGQMGIRMQDIASTLAYTLGGNYVNWFSMEGDSYQVIPQLAQEFRMTPQAVLQLYVKNAKGDLLPLSNIVDVSQTTEPNAMTHFQQLNSAIVEGVLAPTTTMGTALDFLKQKADELLPTGVTYDYGGQSRQFVEEGTALVATFFLALVVIYLVLAAQFESFRDPLIILISVPMSICGALIPLNLGAATINIYTEIGLITLIGLITKHGILMVEFANQLQAEEGLSIRAAIEKAAAIRLRPILMTTAAMVLGVVPLLLASGAGAVSRFDIGLVIFCGMLIGTCFTLFVVPTMYTFFANQHHAKEKR